VGDTVWTGSAEDWSVGNSDGGNGLSNSDGSNSLSNSDSWSVTVDNSVESVDWISGVGDGTDGTIGLNKGVLSLDDISVTGLGSGLGVSGEGIANRIAVVILWVGIKGLRGNSDSLGNYWSSSAEDWSVGDSYWSMGAEDWSLSICYWSMSDSMTVWGTI